MKVLCPKCDWFVEGDHLEAHAMNKAWGEHYLRDHSQPPVQPSGPVEV